MSFGSGSRCSLCCAHSHGTAGSFPTSTATNSHSSMTGALAPHARTYPTAARLRMPPRKLRSFLALPPCGGGLGREVVPRTHAHPGPPPSRGREYGSLSAGRAGCKFDSSFPSQTVTRQERVYGGAAHRTGPALHAQKEDDETE